LESSTNLEKRPISVLLGPALLLAVVVLLLLKKAMLAEGIFWLFGVALATLLACSIAYLTFQEIAAQKRDLLQLISKKEKENHDLRAILDETHLLYREKVSKMEDAIIDCERKQIAELEAKESLEAELTHYKARVRSFEVSLEEALNELRNLAQIHYLEQERQQQIPPNLVKQHQQLREQFEEKSLVLDQTRRRLFETEGFLLALKKERGLELLSQNEEQQTLFKHIEELLAENETLEKEIKELESLISVLSKPTTTPKKTPKKLQEMLEFQFDSTSR
jgi:chromosome segregation ATPase